MTASEAPVGPPAEPPDARPRRTVRVRYVVAAVVCAGAVGWLVVGGLASNIVYLRPVSEAVARRDAGDTRSFRMGGAVVPGSIERTELGDTERVRFEMTDGDATAAVVHTGGTPDLFEDGAPVVCKGRWQGDTFECDRVLIRHGNQYGDDYTPPSVDIRDGIGAEDGGSGGGG